LHRWSARAFSGEPITDQELMQLFEAARWAPSSFNNQPWRFVYAKKGTPAWDTLFNLMVDFNKSWAHNAGALIVIASKETTEKNHAIPTHSFDTGAAWQNLALQAASMGLVAHGMSGFDYAKAKEVLHIPDGYTVEAMIAIGRPGSVENLPEELRAMESAKDRNPVESFTFEGRFPDQILNT
jgi:nitroreductase